MIRKQSKKHKSSLTSVFIGGCSANTCAVHIPEIVVPPVPATDIVSSKILHITYELKVISMCLIFFAKSKRRCSSKNSIFVVVVEKNNGFMVCRLSYHFVI